MAIPCPDIEVDSIDEIEALDDGCGPIDGGVVVRVDLADGRSEVVVDHVPVNGEGLVDYVPGTSFDLAVSSAGSLPVSGRRMAWLAPGRDGPTGLRRGGS